MLGQSGGVSSVTHDVLLGLPRGQEAVPDNRPAVAGRGPQSHPTGQPMIGILGSLGAHDSAAVPCADTVTPGSLPPSPGPPSEW